MRRVVITVAVVLAATHPSTAGETEFVPPASYYRPVVVNGMTFPVARSNWYSLIELREDWHAPRMRRVGGRWRLAGVHEGNDVVAEPGTPVLSMTAGVVEAMGWTFYSGNRVGIRGSDGRFYFYAHLSSYAPGLAEGTRVETGDPLGLVGNTGYGPPGHRDEFPAHLHVGIRGATGWEDPSPLIRRLYRASVRRTTRQERELARLARQGRTQEFEELSSKLYMEPF